MEWLIDHLNIMLNTIKTGCSLLKKRILCFNGIGSYLFSLETCLTGKNYDRGANK
jgi:hypothetical protein